MNKYQIAFLYLVILWSFDVVAAQWTYSKKIDEFSDTETHVARVNNTSGAGFAIARCSNKSNFELYFSVGEFIGTGDSYKVRYRVDKNKLESRKWGISTDGVFIFAGDRDKKHLAREMLAGNLLLLEVKDFRGTPHKSKYSLAGATNTIGKVLDSCGIGRKEVPFEGIDASVVKYVSKWGPKNTYCSKQMLLALNFSITDASTEKTPELYQAMQDYIDYKHSACGTKKATASNTSYRCKKKDRFLLALYMDATARNGAFKKDCGSLRTGD